MGNQFDKLLLLLWKNFLVPRRHPIKTLALILVPVLFSLPLVVIRSLVGPEQHSDMLYTPFKNSLPLNKSFTSAIAWSPKNTILENIMENFAKSIDEKNDGTKIKLVGFDDSHALEQHLNNEFNLITTLAGVQFDDSLAELTTLTPYVNVTFRFPAELRYSTGQTTFTGGSWKTDQLFPTYQAAGPRASSENEGATPSYHHEGFLMLQQELSFSIINYFKQQVHDIPFDHKSVSVYMQRFPYPKWVRDDVLTALQPFIGFIIVLTFLIPYITSIIVITTEKEKQLKEVMKIMGLPNWLHWIAWFIKTFAFLLIRIIIMVVLMKGRWYKGTDHTVFTNSNPFVIFLFLVFYGCATITFSFAISVFFSKAKTAVHIAVHVWILSHIPYQLLQDSYDTTSLFQKLSASLCSNTAMGYGFQLILMFEGNGQGLQWHNIWKTTTPDDNLVMGHIMIMLIVDTLMYLLIALYVEAVSPGKHDGLQPWYFPFTASYWRGNYIVLENEDFEEETIENEFFEKEPTHLQIGVKIQHLRKEFSNKNVAVKNVSLNMYKDQITVLLGQNGAGKSTIISILSGTIAPTSGSAILEGHDIRRDMAGVRQNLGVYPRHNILFDELTVEEHLYFYSRLKGLKKERINEEVNKYVELLDLISKKKEPPSKLSGVMKKKLSVGIALCGDSSVVMCDEPTTGMDPAAKRAVWNLFQSQKKGRTILVTTHHMDEAASLGDRIAIMAGGEIQCCGSSFFLKKKYGVGYCLMLDKSPQCNVDQVTTLLQKYIPNIQVQNNKDSELTYSLRTDNSSIFEKMLGDLEIHSEGLGVRSYDVSLTTLEEAFMKMGANHSEEENYINKTRNEHITLPNGYPHISQVDSYRIEDTYNEPLQTYNDVILNVKDKSSNGCPLWCNQLLAMFMKRALWIMRSWISFITQNCIPILFLVLTMALSKHRNSYNDLPDLQIDLNSYDNPVTVLTGTINKYSEKYIEHFNKNNKILINWEGANMTEKMLEQTIQNAPGVRQRYISGASFEGNSITAWFNNQPYHSPPLSLQLVMNAILQEEVSPDYSIQIHNNPLPFTIKTKVTELFQGNSLGLQIAFSLSLGMAFASAFYIIFYIKERVCKAKHLQFVSGISAIPFWAASFISDFITFIFTSILIIITLAVFQEDGFKTAAELGRVFSVLLYFGFAMMPTVYLSSYVYKSPSSGYTRMALFNIFTGVAAVPLIQILSQSELNFIANIANILHSIFLLKPHYSLLTGIRDIYVIHATDKYCNSVMEKCMDLRMPLLTPESCKEQVCDIESRCCTMTRNYYDMEAPGIGKNVLSSCCVGVILTAILLLIEYRFVGKILYKIRRTHLPSLPKSDAQVDNDVLQEKKKVKHATMEKIKNMDLVMRNVTKYYKKSLTVNRLCVGVNKFECFGLLGVNGAGKTTTLKMLTGDVKLSLGDAWVSGWNLKTDIRKIHQFIGYCPQFDALLDDFTCRETLVIFGLLRGITRNESKFTAEKLAEELSFYTHLDKKIKELNVENKRKLSIAIALIGDPLVIYLDEPTAGMDPVTKRYIWNVLSKIRDSGKCIVLTSRNMEECEALCGRLAIMVNGAFVCLGSTQHLKNKFCEGYTLRIKVRNTETSEELEQIDFQPIEKFVKDNFPGATMREKHQELITFYIANKTLPWSRMFGIMERGKKPLNIEDYSMGQCSLEQAFLRFTKHQREE